MSLCSGKPYCKSDEEIREFINSHTVYLLYNDQRYNPDIFDDDRTIETFVNLESFPLLYETRETIVNSIQKQNLESEPDVSHAIFSPKELEWYKMILRDEINDVLKYDNAALLLAFSTNERVKSFKRSAYNALDLLGDIGGLYDGLKLLSTAILTAISSTDYTSLLISKLFYVRKSMNHHKNDSQDP